MKTYLLSILLFGISFLQACSQEESAPPGADTTAQSLTNAIEGRVLSAAAVPEAGVWVIAETDDLPTPYRKIVVTDDLGRFVIPDLPAAEYRLWVRGYGLRDSAKAAASPGMDLELRAIVAETRVEAAAIYPASYWLSLLNPPDHDADWVNGFKLGCQLCHQVGSLITRIQSRATLDLGLQKASYMNLTADALGRDRLLGVMDDWHQRIVAGETPPAPPRPEGLERNLVITQWGWGDRFTYAHDEIATDKRDPSRFPNGPVYGVDLANDRLLTLDPKTHTTGEIPTPTLNRHDTPWCRQTYKPLGSDAVLEVGFGSLGCPSKPGLTAFGDEYSNPANPHNPVFDDSGRVWITTQVRREWGQDLPEFCRNTPVIADNYHHRQLGWYDPTSGEYELIDTCYGTHHLQFDAAGVLWTSGDSYVIGWFDPK